jgi:hypothetical protein
MRPFMKNLIIIKFGLQNEISPIWMLKFVQWCKDKNIKNQRNLECGVHSALISKKSSES